LALLKTLTFFSYAFLSEILYHCRWYWNFSGIESEFFCSLSLIVVLFNFQGAVAATKTGTACISYHIIFTLSIGFYKKIKIFLFFMHILILGNLSSGFFQKLYPRISKLHHPPTPTQWLWTKSN